MARTRVLVGDGPRSRDPCIGMGRRRQLATFPACPAAAAAEADTASCIVSTGSSPHRESQLINRSGTLGPPWVLGVVATPCLIWGVVTMVLVGGSPQARQRCRPIRT